MDELPSFLCGGRPEAMRDRERAERVLFIMVRMFCDAGMHYLREGASTLGHSTHTPTKSVGSGKKKVWETRVEGKGYASLIHPK